MLANTIRIQQNLKPQIGANSNLKNTLLDSYMQFNEEGGMEDFILIPPNPLNLFPSP